MNLMDFNIVPGIAPVDTAAAAISTQFVDLKTAHEISFLVSFGVITASADDTITLTVNAATVQDGTSAVAIPFKYRVSGAAAANSWGAIADATSAGAAPLSSALTGNMVAVFVDPSTVQTEAEADARWVNLTVTPSAGNSVQLVSSATFIVPRYKQASMVSAT